MAGIADDDDSLTASNPVFVTLLENGKVKARKLSPVECASPSDAAHPR